MISKRAIGIIPLLIELTTCVPTESSRNRCVGPQVNILDTKWTLYQNLIPIKVQTCKMTKITKYQNCQNEFVRSETLTYYDISNNCRDIYGAEPPPSVTKEYSCQNGYKKYITKTIHVTTDSGNVNLEADKLFLPSGFGCKYSLGFCYNFKDEGYVWETKLQDIISCRNLVLLKSDNMTVVKFSLDREYIVFEEKTKALAVELTQQLDLCGEKVWTDKKGLFVTNHTSFNPSSRSASIDLNQLLEKQRVYESLAEDCGKSGGVTDFYHYATIALLAYVLLHLAFSFYGHLTNCRTFGRERGGSCKWLCQSWINRSFMNRSVVTETKLMSDIEMANVGRESCPSYYQLRLPNRNDK